MPRALATVAVVLVCPACRLGFSEQPVTVSDAPFLDAPPVDAPSDAIIVARTFGERSGSMTTGVTVDTTITLDQPMLTSGPSEDLGLYGGGTTDRALLRFELSSLPPGTLVVAARLKLELVDFGDNIVGSLALRVAGEGWSEANASWNQRDTGTAWTSAGGTASAVIATSPPPTTALSFTVPVNIPQSWLDTPATNFGFIVEAANAVLDTHYHLHSSESLVLTARPLLVLDVVQ